MKRDFFKGMGPVAISRYVVIAFTAILISSCAQESLDGPTDALETADLKLGVELETVDAQVERLTQKMRRFHNFQVAMAQGWNFDASGYVPGMGHHYVNESLMDDKFEMLKPEALLYIPGEDGKWEFLAVEYLIFGPEADDPAPDGFIGEEDNWFFNHEVGAWTLHVWVGRHNEAGRFAAFNPAIP